MRHLILGTAGHIDHGKTALVRALTGIDTDRLPEEKERGITIDIGFARLELGEFELGIVDVPGHERFIRNMLAGAAGIDLAMLVVAADDSVMPQTREHLEILQLLGIEHGLVAITKCDLAADEAWLELVEEEVRELVAGTFLASAPIVRTSATTGKGLAELRQQLAELCRHVQRREERELFRMAVDRSFAMPGHGTVVTGSVWSGTLSVGDELEWLPACKRVRVRGLQSHGRPVERVERGQRAAINLAGVHHRWIERGHELAAPGLLRPATVLTARLYVLPSSPWPVKHRARLRFHVGTAERIATVSLLRADRLRPGQSGLAQLFLSEPATAAWGQPFVVRSESPMLTLGGGHVLQPVARPIRRRQTELVEQVQRLTDEDPVVRAGAAIGLYGTSGWTELDLLRDAGVGPELVAETVGELERRGELVRLELEPCRARSVHSSALNRLEERIVRVVRRYHEAEPLQPAMARSKLAAAIEPAADAALVQAVTDRLIAAGRLAGNSSSVRLAEFEPKLSAAARQLRDRIVAAYESAGFQPPELSELQRLAGSRAAVVPELLQLCRSEGTLVDINEQLFLHAKWAEALKRLVTDQLKQAGQLTVSQIRELLNTTRKYAVPFCQYLDRIGVTRRIGDYRVLADRPDAEN